MRSAIRTYALAVDAPDALPKDALIPAAGHYREGCAFCHGAPGVPRNSAVLAMLPVPPELSPTVDDWTDAQLFRIVKHGIRFTGMPAWPSQARGDEVWMMVAFLRALPELDSDAYRGLAAADAALPEPLARCAACHGADGRGGGAHVPILAGQSETYLRESLRAYAEGHRASGIMQMAVRGLSPAELAALARHYAALPGAEPPEPRPAIDRAAELAKPGPRGRRRSRLPRLPCRRPRPALPHPRRAARRLHRRAARALPRRGPRRHRLRPSDDPGRSGPRRPGHRRVGAVLREHGPCQRGGGGNPVEPSNRRRGQALSGAPRGLACELWPPRSLF